MTEPGDVAAIFVEPIQGEGGYVVPPAGWLAELRELCDRHGILLVMDEVQSGVGRTGKMWACEHDGVVPDIITAGKGLASGLPLAAIIARDDIMQWAPGKHGSTFGGNPVACAAAVAHARPRRERAGGQRRSRGRPVAGRAPDAVRSPADDHRRAWARPDDRLRRHRSRHRRSASSRPASERGLLVLTCGQRGVRMAPPLVVTADQADTALAILADACEAVAAGLLLTGVTMTSLPSHRQLVDRAAALLAACGASIADG